VVAVFISHCTSSVELYFSAIFLTADSTIFQNTCFFVFRFLFFSKVRFLDETGAVFRFLIEWSNASAASSMLYLTTSIRTTKLLFTRPFEPYGTALVDVEVKECFGDHLACFRFTYLINWPLFAIVSFNKSIIMKFFVATLTAMLAAVSASTFNETVSSTTCGSNCPGN
jgi:hypothetical protein